MVMRMMKDNDHGDPFCSQLYVYILCLFVLFVVCRLVCVIMDSFVLTMVLILSGIVAADFVVMIKDRDIRMHLCL